MKLSKSGLGKAGLAVAVAAALTLTLSGCKPKAADEAKNAGEEASANAVKTLFAVSTSYNFV